MNQDPEHLKLLSIFHYVVSGLTALFSLFGIIYLVLGLMMILSPEKLDPKGPPPPEFLGWIFAIMGGLFITLGWFFCRIHCRGRTISGPAQTLPVLPGHGRN